jgi:hypothetical protein
MNKFLVSIAIAAALCGCMSHSTLTAPPVSARPRDIPTAAPATATQAQELAALRQTPTPAAPVPIRQVEPPIRQVEPPIRQVEPPIRQVEPLPPAPPLPLPAPYAKAGKSHKLIYWLLTTVLAVPLTYAAKKYGLPLFKKLLAWVKTHDTAAALKTLASGAESKIAVVFKDVEADFSKKAAVAPVAAAPPAPVAAPHSVAEKVVTVPLAH